MTLSARRAKRPSRAWMVDCGGLLTQPLWRPCSVAWIVASSGAGARRASRSAAPPTSQSWPWTRSGSSSSTSCTPARTMCAFMLRTHCTKAWRSAGYSGSATRWTWTPWRTSCSLVRVPPRVSTCTSTSSPTSASESLRTCRASPPSTIGGDSQEGGRTRTDRARTVSDGMIGRMAVTVVGAGVVGLTCAVALREAGFDVRVLARAEPQIVSDVAGGLWLPYTTGEDDRTMAWARATYERLEADGAAMVDYLHIE